MHIKVFNDSILNFAGDLLIVNLFEGVKIPGGATGAIDGILKGMITKFIRDGEITGKIGDTFVFHTCGKLKAKKVIVVGLGKSDKFDVEAIRKASGAAANLARKAKAKHVGTIAHGAGIGGISPEFASQALAEGTLLALYRFDQYKKSGSDGIKEFSVIEVDKDKVKKFKKGLEMGQILAKSQNIARDLTNEPANNLTPEKLDKRLRDIMSQSGLARILTYRSMDRRQIEKMKMGAILSVSMGSSNEPRFITLRMKNPKKPLICLIGKAVTFDSGGISLKPGEGMYRMKGDMAGGAAVIGAALALGQMEPEMNLLVVIPAVENMPSGTASRPGDVVRAMNGKTIEIISTDAEGRMVLADAMLYAEKEGAKTIVDIATLTGGCQVAFGDLIAAVMGNDQRLMSLLMSAASETGEHMWQLPLLEEYEDKMKSDIADLRNSGGRDASTITAGLFLKAFAGKCRWIHIDIAGKEMSDREGYYQPKGGTGFGVRTLFEFCRRMARS